MDGFGQDSAAGEAAEAAEGAKGALAAAAATWRLNRADWELPEGAGRDRERSWNAPGKPAHHFCPAVPCRVCLDPVSVAPFQHEPLSLCFLLAGNSCQLVLLSIPALEGQPASRAPEVMDPSGMLTDLGMLRAAGSSHPSAVDLYWEFPFFWE